MDGKIVQPDDKEAAVAQAEHLIRMAVHADERWKNRMANEDKITTNAIEVPRSDLNKMSAKMAEDVVCLKSRHQGSAASTGSGGSVGNFAARTVQNTFVASRRELKGWSCSRNIRGTGITLDEAKEYISMAKARLKQDDLNVFDWDSIKEILTQRWWLFVWFKEEVTPMVRKRVQLDLQQYLTVQPLEFNNAYVRATLELDPVKRPWNEAPAHFHWSDEGICQNALG